MARLVDELDANDPKHAYVAELLRAGGPIPESEVSRQRVRRALQKPRPRARLGLLRPALAVAMLFALAGTAGAAWGIASWISPNDGEETSSSSMEELKERTGENPRAEESIVPAEKKGRELEAKPAEAASSATSASPEERTDRASQREDATTKKAEVMASPRAGRPAPETTKKLEQKPSNFVLLHQAAEALRSSEDPKKAARLLREYDQERRSGALDEEALALGIEAALANDDPKAKKLARRYLARYPEGRFRRLALRAISEQE